MFEAIVSKITNGIRTSVRAVATTARRTPWLASAVALAFLFLIF